MNSLFAADDDYDDNIAVVSDSDIWCLFDYPFLNS